MRAYARVEPRERAEREKLSAAEGLSRLRVLSSTEVVALYGAAHEHVRLEPREPARRVRGERGRAVALNDDRVHFRATTPHFAERCARECGARPRPDLGFERRIGRLTYLHAALYAPREDRQLEALRQPFNEPHVRAALDDE